MGVSSEVLIHPPTFSVRKNYLQIWWILSVYFFNFNDFSSAVNKNMILLSHIHIPILSVGLVFIDKTIRKIIQYIW